MSIFKKLFNKIEQEDFRYSSNVKRSAAFKEGMKSSEEGIRFLVNHLRYEWQKGKLMEEDISTYVLDREDVAGIVFKIKSVQYKKHYHFLVEHIKDQLLKIEYHLHVNKHLTQRVDGKYTELFSYFLKPKPSFSSENKYNQRYGTISIELKEEDNNSFHFKLQCGYYAGFNYEEPIGFTRFLEIL